MTEPVDALILDLLAWLGPEPRPYAEVLEAWRTSCPRLPVWEDANARGFITRGRGAVVSLSPAGAEHLRAQGRLGLQMHAIRARATPRPYRRDDVAR